MNFFVGFLLVVVFFHCPAAFRLPQEPQRVNADLERDVTRGTGHVSAYNYTGYLEVNATTGSSLFYWFFPSQDGNVSAPVLLWLQGGYGSSSLFGLFVEHGPYTVTPQLKLAPREITWNKHFAMLYVDNPVGTGFSFTNKKEGYVTNQHEMARDLYAFLCKFFVKYPQFAANDFYVTGESMAGKYVPTITHKILKENDAGHPLCPIAINIKGMALGNGLCDPITQVTNFPQEGFRLGLTSPKQFRFMQNMMDKTIAAINKKQWHNASTLVNNLPGYIIQSAGTEDIYDCRRTVEPVYPPFPQFVNSTKIRPLLHVGRHYYTGSQSATVYKYLFDDFAKSVKYTMPYILSKVKALFYNGNFDILVAASSTEVFLASIDWPGAMGFKEAERIVWKIKQADVDVAGYHRTYDKLTHVVIRGAGHMAPMDQPASAYDMITRWVNGKPFTN